MPDIHDKLEFPQTDEKYNSDYNYKISADCLCYRHRISLSANDEKLEDIFNNLAIFNWYKIKEIIVVSEDDGMMVRPRDGCKPFPYERDTFYENVDFFHPELERILAEEDYEINFDFECVSGDYFFSPEASNEFTAGQLRKILVLDLVKRVEIELNVLEE